MAVDGSLEAQTSVDDNYQLTLLPHPTVLVLKLTPNLSISESTESQKFHLDGSITTFEVARQRGDDHTNESLSVGYEINDLKDTYSIRGGYLRDLTIESELANTGVLLSSQERRDITLSPSWTHQFSTRWQSQIAVQADATRYGGQFAVTGLSNYHYYTLPLSTSYLASERDSLSLSLSPSLYRADEIESQTMTTQLDLTWQHQLTETTQFNLDLGAFRARTKATQDLSFCPVAEQLFCLLGIVPIVTIPVQSVSVLSGSIVHAGFEDQLSESDRLGIHLARDLSPSGAGTLLLIESVNAGISRDITPETQLNLGLTATRTRFLGSTSAYSAQYQSLFSDLVFKIAPNAKLETGIKTVTTSAVRNGPVIRGNEMYATFLYTWPTTSLDH